jgi:hypothetical protein
VIPSRTRDLDDLVAECHRQDREIAELFEGLDAGLASRKPDPAKWSMAGHLAHVVILNGRYLPVMEAAIREARASGVTGDGPFRHPWFASWFARQQEPPPKMRIRTARAMVPDPEREGDALAEFRSLQIRLAGAIDAARGLDLGRVRFASPFLSILRLSLGTGFEILMAHNRRHIWLIHEVNRALTMG